MMCYGANRFHRWPIWSVSIVLQMQTISQAVSELSLAANLIFAFCNKFNLLAVHLLHDKCEFECQIQNWCINCTFWCLWTDCRDVPYPTIALCWCGAVCVCVYSLHVHAICIQTENWVMRIELLTKMIIHISMAFPSEMINYENCHNTHDVYSIVYGRILLPKQIYFCHFSSLQLLWTSLNIIRA